MSAGSRRTHAGDSDESKAVRKSKKSWQLLSLQAEQQGNIIIKPGPERLALSNFPGLMIPVSNLGIEPLIKLVPVKDRCIPKAIGCNHNKLVREQSLIACMKTVEIQALL